MAKKFFLPTQNSAVHNLLLKYGYEVANDENTADFYVLTGGSDISPVLYDETDDKGYGLDKPRDLRELFYINKAKLLRIHVTGVCRGFQLLNVVNGSSFISDIKHHNSGMHEVHSCGKSKATKTPSLVNSSHHQAVPKSTALMLDYDEYLYTEVGTGMFILEAGSCKRKNFSGVQYHPEYSNCTDSGVEYWKHLIELNLA